MTPPYRHWTRPAATAGAPFRRSTTTPPAPGGISRTSAVACVQLPHHLKADVTNDTATLSLRATGLTPDTQHCLAVATAYIPFTLAAAAPIYATTSGLAATNLHLENPT
ncbi:hypothetical protein GCM10027610_025030 [Dactylosporangium cerinum]